MKFEAGGVEYLVSVNVAGIKRIRQLLDVDLCDLPADPDLLQRLMTDDVLLVDCLYLLCKPQIDAAGLTDEEFGEALGAVGIEPAEQAFWDAITDFFRPPRRQALEDMLAASRKQLAWRTTMLGRAMENPETLTRFQELDQELIQRAIETQLSLEQRTGSVSR